MNSQHVLQSSSDKRDIAAVFRERMARLIADRGLNLSQFARSVGVDRSALSQFLAPDSTRLPRVETLCAISATYGVSLDWLTGLVTSDSVGGEEKAPITDVVQMDGVKAHRQINEWFREATGYKIRYVPYSIPYHLRIDEVWDYEFREVGLDENMQEFYLDQARNQLTDLEVCMPLQTFDLFMKGEGIWQDFPKRYRIKQMDFILERLEELYPAFRLFLFDQQTVNSSPFTLYGPLRGVFSVGDTYLVVNSVEHIRMIGKHFDSLIRAATVTPERAADYLSKLRKDLIG